MTAREASAAQDHELALSFVRDDFPFRWMRKLGLVPETGLGTGRRAIFLALLAWLPIALWAVYAGRAFPPAPGEPLLQHFGVHVRGLIAIPLLILAQGFAHHMTTLLVPWFVHSGRVRQDDRERFRAIVGGIARLRDAALPWALILALALAWTFFGPAIEDAHEVAFAAESAGGQAQIGFGGRWFLWVSRPIYVVLLLAWLWRLILLALFFARVAKLDLTIVPTHPDRTGGLGFVERFALIQSTPVFALSAVFAAHWGHQVLYHGESLDALQWSAIAFVTLALIVSLAPFLAFVRPLYTAKARALLEYGALVGEHDNLVRKRWILGERIEDAPLLDAPELGPVVDVGSIFEAVKRMRIVPIGIFGLVAIIGPAVVPMIIVAAIKIPIGELLIKLLHTVA